MKVQLLFSDRDATLTPEPPAGADDLIADLDLQPVLALMVPDTRLLKAIPNLLLLPLTDPIQIRWRQRVLADALADPAGLRGLFELAGQALESQHGLWMYSERSVDSLRNKSVLGLQALLPHLRALRHFALGQVDIVRSPGLRGLYQRLIDELEAGYLERLAELLKQLEFPTGVVSRGRVTAAGLIGELEVLAPRQGRRDWRAALGLAQHGRLHFTIGERDEAGAKAIAELRDDALCDVTGILARANSHVLGFFRQLRWEAGFYVGCLQLHERVAAAGVSVCWPDPEPPGTAPAAEGLVSLSLVVRSGVAPTANDLEPGGGLVIITGANQGGKTTFLRSVGCAQLLLQAGVFVPASAYRAGLADGIHSHFRRGEDEDLRIGKLDEELVRMSAIVDRCRPGDLLLMNESFSSTDEVEGTYIAGDLLDALLRHGVRIVLVTHFHLLAERYRDRSDVTFLVAERLPDGRRSHRVRPGQPLATSFALDVYQHVFGEG